MTEPVTIRPLDPALDLDWANSLLDAEFGGRMQARRGELVDALDPSRPAGSGLVAAGGPERRGLLTWFVASDGADAEIRSVVLVPEARREGIGRALVEAAHIRLRELGVRRAWLVTTNDNLVALALYQQIGYRLVALRTGAVDEARRTLKPAIGRTGDRGIPIRDELELVLEL